MPKGLLPITRSSSNSPRREPGASVSSRGTVEGGASVWGFGAEGREAGRSVRGRGFMACTLVLRIQLIEGPGEHLFGFVMFWRGATEGTSKRQGYACPLEQGAGSPGGQQAMYLIFRGAHA